MIQVDVAILDFEKAFDKVANTRLVHKLHYYGIRGDMLQWIQSFLINYNRTQRVVINSTCQGRIQDFCNGVSISKKL